MSRLMDRLQALGRTVRPRPLRMPAARPRVDLAVPPGSAPGPTPQSSSPAGRSVAVARGR